MGENQWLDLGYYYHMNICVLSQNQMLKHNPQSNRHENVRSLGAGGREDPTLMHGIKMLKGVPEGLPPFSTRRGCTDRDVQGTGTPQNWISRRRFELGFLGFQNCEQPISFVYETTQLRKLLCLTKADMIIRVTEQIFGYTMVRGLGVKSWLQWLPSDVIMEHEQAFHVTDCLIAFILMTTTVIQWSRSFKFVLQACCY